MSDLIEKLRAQAADFVAIRRDLHRHPEMGYKEFRTSDLVAKSLQEWGYEVARGFGGTGLVGQLRKGSGGRSLGIRADMDALPLQEMTGLSYQSSVPDVMHACGHDGHTAILLAAAKELATTEFSGTLNLIFQPAEESLGGARRMMDDGLFTRFPCDAIFALHNMPGTPTGRLVLREGPTMASADNVTIVLHGKGGHGAFPHLGADPVLAGASIVMALQSIVARNIDPQKTAVVSVGTFQAGSNFNVIPQTAMLRLSVRSLDHGVHDLLEQRIRDLVTTQAQSYGVRAEIDYHRSYPVLVNTPSETEFARQVARELVGEAEMVAQAEAMTGSEDFAFMLEEVPGSYVFLGNGDGAGSCMVHNPGYDFNDEILPVGAAYWVLLTQRFLR